MSTDTESSLYLHPDRNIALELVRATEAAAIRSYPWIGRGDKLAADGAAVDAMRAFLGTVNFDGVVVIGEGEKDEAPMMLGSASSAAETSDSLGMNAMTSSGEASRPFQ